MFPINSLPYIELRCSVRILFYSVLSAVYVDSISSHNISSVGFQLSRCLMHFWTFSQSDIIHEIVARGLTTSILLDYFQTSAILIIIYQSSIVPVDILFRNPCIFRCPLYCVILGWYLALFRDLHGSLRTSKWVNLYLTLHLLKYLSARRKACFHFWIFNLSLFGLPSAINWNWLTCLYFIYEFCLIAKITSMSGIRHTVNSGLVLVNKLKQTLRLHNLNYIWKW